MHQLQVANFSAKRIVLDVPSVNVVPIRGRKAGQYVVAATFPEQIRPDC